MLTKSYNLTLFSVDCQGETLHFSLPRTIKHHHGVQDNTN